MTTRTTTPGNDAGRDARTRVDSPTPVGADLLAISDALSDRVATLRFADPVAHVYNPLAYARALHAEWLERHARRGVDALLVGMNPGPFGMAQTGVPFGEIAAVRGFLGLGGDLEADPTGGVEPPTDQHPKRPIEGLACTRSEVSGRRVWGWAAERFGCAERFFERFFVTNWCPLAFLGESGRNITPDRLPVAEREPLEAACDDALRRIVEAVEPRMVIGVGAFARKRATLALGKERPIGSILHPSPASPAANRGWAPQIEKQLRELGIRLD